MNKFVKDSRSQQNLSFLMLVGLPYSGKSHLVKTLGLDKDYTIISSDLIILEWAVERESTYNEIFKECVDAAQKESVRRMLEAFKQNKNVLVDQTNLTKASRSRKLRLVPPDYKKTCIIIPSPSKEELEIRKQERNTHKVPDSVLNQMELIYQKPELDEGFDTIYYAGFDDIIITKET